MNDRLEQYILDHTDQEGDYLYRLWRATNIHTIHGRMASGHLQGRLLKMLVMMPSSPYGPRGGHVLGLLSLEHGRGTGGARPRQW